MARENRWPEYPARIFGHHVGKAGRAMPAQTAAAMPLGAHCNHCEADDAVVPAQELLAEMGAQEPGASGDERGGHRPLSITTTGGRTRAAPTAGH